jgi:hypothetical protein
MWNINSPYRDRDETLRRMGFKSYQHYLQSSLWRDIRQRAIDAAQKRCVRCGRNRGKGVTLQVHHRAYDLRTLVGGDLRSLSVVCKGCHKLAEKPTRQQDPNDRLHNANETVLSKFVPQKHLSRAERCWEWYRRNQRWLPKLENSDQALRMIQLYREWATAPGAPRCSICGSVDFNPNLPNKMHTGRLYCGQHVWGEVRAAARALTVDLTRD